MRRGTMTAAALAVALAACGGGEGDGDGRGFDGIEGSGVIVQDARELAPFHGVRLEGAGRVELVSGAEQGVVVEADDNVVDRVRTEVVDGMLAIGLEPGSYRNVTLILHVASPALDRLELDGAGEMEGSVGEVGDLSVRLDGGGELTLAGAADRVSIALAGAGSIHAYELGTGRCSVTLEGAGKVEVTVSEHLDAVVAGVGDIRYDGAPTVDQTVTGLGSVRHR